MPKKKLHDEHQAISANQSLLPAVATCKKHFGHTTSPVCADIPKRKPQRQHQ
ncbi:MAG: hypothetical protein AAB657_00680 [Patescibacteria group bacterium]